MPKQAKKVPVSRRAVIQRVNRKLAPEWQQLKTSRGKPGGAVRSNLGDYYVLNTHHNVIVNYGFDLEALARDLKALAEWEVLSDE